MTDQQRTELRPALSVDNRRRVLLRTGWVAPVIHVVTLPAHAQTSVADEDRSSGSSPATRGNVVITQILWQQTASADPAILVDEYVEIRNDDTVNINLENWVLRCLAQNFDFVFPARVLQPGETCRIFSHIPQGANTWPCEETFGLTSPGAAGNYIWNNTGDTAQLIDATMAIVDSATYTNADPNPAVFP